MSHRPSGAALRQFRTLFHLGTTGDLSDGQLLERFATGRGEAAELAFSAIVERHGPLVLRVCRAVLRDEHDAQDAFQATFLVLVRKAPSLWVRDSLGPWLHSVAHRAARCSRANRRRRRSIEGAFPTIDPGLVAVDPAPPDDLAEVLHAEINRLPHRQRDPVILCDLEGLTLEQAARRLGCPVGTVKSRLSRARDRLRGRLSRRGLAPEGRVSPVIALGGARVLVPSGLVRSTIELAVQSASGSAAGVAVPAAVALIAQGVSSVMIQLKIAQLAVPVLAVALSAGAGLGASGYGRPADGTAPGGQGTGQSVGDNPEEELPAQGNGSPDIIRTPIAYAGVTSLQEAVEVARQPVDRRGGKVQGHPYDALLILLTEERVREAIPRAIKEYEVMIELQDEGILNSRDYFYSEVRPRLAQIAEEGAWPEGSFFDYFPIGSPDEAVSGYSLTLHVGTPGKADVLPGGRKGFVGFALPIIRVSFGQFDR